MIIADQWTEYKLLDTGDGEKVESWAGVILRRPDPQAIWPWTKGNQVKDRIDAHYHRSKAGGGEWEYKKRIPGSWTIHYKNLTFKVEPTGFKHTGLFPEQAANWEWMTQKIKDAGRQVSVLNLFAYTGGATCACLAAGASVCHVDASKGMVSWARENVELSGLSDKPVRFIIDDCMKFVQREIRRGKRYDAIIMDPPSYGRGPNGELWKLEDELFRLVDTLKDVMSDKPAFFLLNSYTTGFSPQVSANMLELSLRRKFGGGVSCGEVGLPITDSSIILPCGTFARWEK
ncbi:MAG: class I SAM-dependent methyltransferase [Clostridia bacterium]|nr:class I SAM-dependent methyltransferase [Clostridia bacterium]